jgi:hypothetical protein
MEKQTTKHTSSSSSLWEQLEAFVRQHIQHLIQALLEEEVTTLLQRLPSARRTRVDTPSGYRNGHGQPRRIAMSVGPGYAGWVSALSVGSCCYLSGGPARWVNSCRTCTCTAWRWATSSSHCAACWGTQPHYQPPLWPS